MLPPSLRQDRGFSKVYRIIAAAKDIRTNAFKEITNTKTHNTRCKTQREEKEKIKTRHAQKKHCNCSEGRRFDGWDALIFALVFSELVTLVSSV